MPPPRRYRPRPGRACHCVASRDANSAGSKSRWNAEAPTPDHSTISRTRRRIAVETYRAVFTRMQQRLVAAGRVTGRTVAIDAPTLEANAAMRSLVRPDTGESYQDLRIS